MNPFETPTIPLQEKQPRVSEKSDKDLAKNRLAMLAFVSALELSGCAPGKWLEKSDIENEQPLNTTEVSWLAKGPRNAALNRGQEELYIYGLTATGDPVIVSEKACATGTETGVSVAGAISSSCEEVFDNLESRKDIHRIAHVHTHPTASMTKLDQLSVFYKENLSSGDIRKLREGKLWHAVPPSVQDLLGLGTIDFYAPTVVADQPLEKRVVDAGGVWTFAVDPHHPVFETLIHSHQRIERAGKPLLEASDFSEAEKDALMKMFQPPFTGIIPPGSKKFRQVAEQLMQLYRKEEQQLQVEWREVGTLDLMREWESKQLELGAHPSGSRPELQERINEFIEFASENGVRLSYEPFER